MKALLGLGSNIHPARNLESACRRLAHDCRLLGLSRPWRTPAVGSDGPPFLNAVAEVETSMEQESLRRWLRAIEGEHGRVRGKDPNAPRTLDIDLLAVEQAGQWSWLVDVAQEPYNLLPLADLRPDLVLADGRTAAQHAQDDPMPEAFPWMDAGKRRWMERPAALEDRPPGR